MSVGPWFRFPLQNFQHTTRRAFIPFFKKTLLNTPPAVSSIHLAGSILIFAKLIHTIVAEIGTPQQQPLRLPVFGHVRPHYLIK